jgi:outer membrane receptor protein involved in Fe transport
MKTFAVSSRILLFAVFCCAMPSGALGQNVASVVVRGTVTDPTGALIERARVTLTSSREKYDRTVITDDEGRYRFSDVPCAPFRLHVEAPGFAPANFKGDTGKAASVFYVIQFKGATTDIQQITVTDSVPGTAASSSAHVEFDEDQMEMRPLQSPNRDLAAVVESVPGVVPEENGRMHVRGAEAQPQYVIDGVPFAESLSNTFATAPDTENLRSTEVITGNLPAEFGERTAGVINLTTRSGLEMPWSSSLSLSGGSFDSEAVDAELGGHVKNVGVFVTADTSRTSRFLDPPEIQNFHNKGGLAHLFTRFDWSPSQHDAVHLTLAMGGSDFGVPNLAEQQDEGQSLHQKLRDDYQALTWTHTFNPGTIGDVSLFRRSSTARLLDPRITGTPFFLTQSRRQRSEGLHANLSREWRRHSIKGGVEARRVPLNEAFTLAVTDPEEIKDEDPTAKVLAYTMTNPFLFHEQRTGTLSSAFLQDRLKVGEHLTLDLGLRLDHPDLIVHGTEVSPRVGIAYHIARTKTTLHASHNRLIGVPALENLLLASSPQARLLESAREAGDGETSNRSMRLERQSQYQFGFRQQLGRRFEIGVLHYVKNISNTLDDEQLFQTAIVFPVALAAADIRGTEVRAEIKPWSGWSGYFSYANARATVTAPIVGGLLLTREDEFNDPGVQFPADSDERNEAQFGVTYSHKSGLWGSFDARYDSGIPANLEDVDFSLLDPRIQQQLDPIRSRIRPRTLLNFAVGAELFRESSHSISLQLGVNNLADRFYLYNFHSIFSGTHIGRPREVIARMTFHWGKR